MTGTGHAFTHFSLEAAIAECGTEEDVQHTLKTLFKGTMECNACEATSRRGRRLLREVRDGQRTYPRLVFPFNKRTMLASIFPATQKAA